MAKIDLITISRQFGAGGSDLGKALGQKLGWRVLDREIIYEAASLLESDVASTAYLDETVTTALQTILKSFASAMPEVAIEPSYEVDPDEIARATHRVILVAARAVPLIVVGHGVQCLFAERPGTLHVRVVSPMTNRARSIAERMNVDVEHAAAEAARRDTQRARYLRHHFNADNNDPMLYSVQFNTAGLAVPEVASAIEELVHTSGGG